MRQKNIMKEKTCFKNPNRCTCIALFLINNPHSFQNTMTFSTGLSDFHKMIKIILNSSFIKLEAKETYYKSYQKFSSDLFKLGLALSLDGTNKDYDSGKFLIDMQQ